MKMKWTEGERGTILTIEAPRCLDYRHIDFTIDVNKFKPMIQNYTRLAGYGASITWCPQMLHENLKQTNNQKFFCGGGGGGGEG